MYIVRLEPAGAISELGKESLARALTYLKIACAVMRRLPVDIDQSH